MNSINTSIQEGNVWKMTTKEKQLYFYKQSHRPENKKVYDKPNDTGNYGTRRRTRPWDNCWFSNKPHIINLTVEEAICQYPDYILWCYKNLSIKWSVHTIKLIEASMNRPRRMTIDEFRAIRQYA
jgi:hypothetical protein